MAEGGVHRVDPLGALTRLGYWATYWAVWSTMIWFDTKVSPTKWPDHDHGDVGLEELGRVARVHDVDPTVGARGDEVDPAAVAVDRPGHHQALEPEGLRPQDGLALKGLVHRLEVVERTAEALHQEKDEGADEDDADHDEPAALLPSRPVRGRRAGPVRTLPPDALDRSATSTSGRAGRSALSASTVPATSASRRRRPRRPRRGAIVGIDAGGQSFEAAAAPPQLDGVAAQDGEGDGVAGVDVAHSSPSDQRSRRAMSRSAPSRRSDRTWMR